MSELYNSKYKEINVNFLLKKIFESKIQILIISSLVVLFSTYWAYSINEEYESKALLKIGQYHVLEKNGNTSIKYLDSAKELTKELSFLFIDKGNEQASVVKIFTQKNIENYIEIVSRGVTPEHSSSVIDNLVKHVQHNHSKILNSNKKQHELELKSVVDKINIITNKQQKLLLKDNLYDNESYTSLLNTLQLMSIINSDLGMGYIGQMLERKEKIELLLGGEYETNTQLVGKINTPTQPASPKKRVIIFFGFFIGIFLSVVIVFLRELFSKQHPK